MKLREYLKQFEGMDLDADVIHLMSVGCCGDTDTMEDPEVDANKFEFKKEQHSYVQIVYPPFDYLNSCRKYGARIK